ncbi:MAG: uridine kinase [Clostridia bacterium]|nr:uridine kinase [Clostridia bacterium]
MIFIGICGASGSGKTTLANELCRRVHARCALINQDTYYLDHPNMSFEERKKLNYDEPYIFDHDLLYNDVRLLMAGQEVPRKAYDYTLHRRAESTEVIYPADVLILEGIHAFFDERLTDLMFLKLYINVEPDICLLRRINRDILERGRQIENISEQYLTTVKPMYEKYIRNYVNDADVIVTRGGHNARIVDILAGYRRDELMLHKD